MSIFARSLTILALLTCLAVPAGAQGVDQVLLLDFPHPPYAFGKVGEHPDKGISVRIADEIFMRLAVPCTITLAPWTQALAEAEKGKADGLTLLMKTPDRESFLVFSDRVLTSFDRLFYLESNLPGFIWQGVSDLKGKRIGLVAGYAYGANFPARAAGAGASLAVYPDSAHCLAALAKGEIDLAADEEATAEYLIKENPAWKNAIKAAFAPIASTPYYLALSKKSKASSLMPDINRVLTAMRNDGSLQRILDNH